MRVRAHVMTTRADEPKRHFTKEDWKALHFVHRLMEAVAVGGAPALRTFLAAAKEFPDA